MEFNESNWEIDLAVTAIGQDDGLFDGSQTRHINLAVPPNRDGISSVTIPLINTDNE